MKIIPKRIFGKSLEHAVYGFNAVINKYRGYKVVGRLTILNRNVGGDINVRKIWLNFMDNTILLYVLWHEKKVLVSQPI